VVAGSPANVHSIRSRKALFASGEFLESFKFLRAEDSWRRTADLGTCECDSTGQEWHVRHRKKKATANAIAEAQRRVSLGDSAGDQHFRRFDLLILAEHFFEDDRVPGATSILDRHKILTSPATETQFFYEVHFRQ
jgi:hypothetical protein